MEEIVIVTITAHRMLGYVFLPYLVNKNTGKDFYTVKSRLQPGDVAKYPERFTEGEREILKITESYSDQELYRVFSKKKTSVRDFQSKLTDDFLNDHIKPYIERRLVKCIDIIVKYELPLYFKLLTDTVHEADKIKMNREPAKAVFNFIRKHDGMEYFLTLRHGEKSYALAEKNGIILTDRPCRLVLDNDLFIFNDIDGKKLIPFFSKKSIHIPRAKEREFMRVFVSRAIRNYEVNISGFEVKNSAATATATLMLERDLNLLPTLELNVKYTSANTSGEKTKGERIYLEENDNGFIFYKQEQDKELERNIHSFLSKSGLVKNRFGVYTLSEIYNKGSEDEINDTEVRFQLLNWVALHQRELKDMGVRFQQPSAQPAYFVGVPKLTMQVDEKPDWFDVHAWVIFGGFKIPFHKLFKNIRQKERHYILPDETIAILPEEWFSTYKNLAKFAQPDKEKMTLRKHHAMLLPEPENNSAFLKKFKGIDTEKIENIHLPDGLRATLRPYQMQGYQWMKLLQENNFGACLADDMGLGKTLQTITLLQKLKEEASPGAIKPSRPGTQLSLFNDVEEEEVTGHSASLIVLPSSLIHNWKNEISKFAPSIKVYEHTGAKRTEKSETFDDFHVILTTYGIVRNDRRLLASYPFMFLILDESQVIKNPNSKSYEAVNALLAKYRIVLTGTPVENSLNDLWAQLNFLNKGMLGSLSFFQREFVVPVEKKNDEQARETLKNLIRPFILRRTKSEVAKDLPDLTENTIYCDMPEEHQHYYEEEKARIRNYLLESLHSKAVNEMRVMVFAALTRLRQISNHPLLVEDSFEGESGKFEEVIRTLETIRSGNHKVLIFSSFVKHLNLFEDYFTSHQLKYSKLTGATKNREEVVESFQNDSENCIFLISIKAGGVGLNLTAADYVFVLDPWWNPAVENQAINRAHRIGQDKHVFVYKFISKNTIEEKITGLQKRKAKLAGDFIENNNPLAALDKNEVMALFE